MGNCPSWKEWKSMCCCDTLFCYAYCCLKMRRCHCRKDSNKIPREEELKSNQATLEQLTRINLNGMPPLQEQLSFFRLTVAVTVYSWALVIASIYSIVVVHVFPIINDPWYTCKPSNLHSGNQVTCSLLFHYVDFPVIAQALATAAYGLRYFDRSNYLFFNSCIYWNNIVFVGMYSFEISTLYHGFFVPGAPTSQQIVIFTMVLIFQLGVVLGLWCNYTSYLYSNPKPDRRFIYPTTEKELVRLVRQAYATRKKLRVAGSMHSLKLGIFADAEPNGDSPFDITVSLQEYYGIVSIDKEKKRITFKGGTILGREETNPVSTWDNGICKQIDDMGWAVGDTGGVVKQTLAGFIAMGCAGGSIYHDFYDFIYSIRIIDGTGTIHEYTRPSDNNQDDPFFGISTSMGLCGVISTVTLQCCDRFNAIGSQMTLSADEWKTHKNGPKEDGDGTGPLDLFADNKNPDSVYNLIMSKDNRYKTEYMRFFWWPQVETNKIVMWKAHQEREEDQKTEEWGSMYKNGVLVPTYYIEIGNANNTELLQGVVSLFYHFFDALVGRNNYEIPTWLIPVVKLIANVANEDTKDPMIFGATWYDILPMDQGIDDRLMPFQFTELWLDINDTDRAMRALRSYFDTDVNYNHKGLFGWELYQAGPAKEWMRPGYCPPGEEMSFFRIDGLWFDVDYKIPYNFWVPLWKHLINEGINFRPHWAKWCPFGTDPFPHPKLFKTWADYYRSKYPKFNDFLKLRAQCDPGNIFLTPYWAQQLGISDEVLLVEGT